MANTFVQQRIGKVGTARLTFQEEYLKLLKHFGIPYDPRYVFD